MMTNDFYADAQIHGFLTTPMRLLVDTYAALNPSEDAVWDHDVIGGALLEAQAPASMGEGALASILDQLDAIDIADARQQQAARDAGGRLDELLNLPEPARDAALEAAGKAGWKMAGPGIRVMELARQGANKAELLRIEPGYGAPTHGHGGEEFTLVLTGAFSDGGRVYRRGEVCVASSNDVHRPIAEPGDVCYALAVTDAPLEFRGVLGLMQKVMGRA